MILCFTLFGIISHQVAKTFHGLCKEMAENVIASILNLLRDLSHAFCNI